jgi:hypothetical protein
VPFPEGPENPTCVCGSPHWHKMVDQKVLWCQRCGAIRGIFQDNWKIPLDRVGDIARSTQMPEEETTRPGTPVAKKIG